MNDPRAEAATTPVREEVWSTASALGFAAAAIAAFVFRGGWNLDPQPPPLANRIEAQAVEAGFSFAVAFFVALAVRANRAWSVGAIVLVVAAMFLAVRDAGAAFEHTARAGMTPGSGIGVILMPLFGFGIAIAIIGGATLGLGVLVLGAFLGARALGRREASRSRRASFVVVVASAALAALGGDTSGVFLVSLLACAAIVVWSRVDRSLTRGLALGGPAIAVVIGAASAYGQIRAMHREAARAQIAALPPCTDHPFEPLATGIDGVLGVREPLYGEERPVAPGVIPLWVAVDAQHDANGVIAAVQTAIDSTRCEDSRSAYRARAIAARPIPVTVEIEAYLTEGADEAAARQRAPELWAARYAHDVRNRRSDDPSQTDFAVSQDFVREGPVEYSFRFLDARGQRTEGQEVGAFIRPIAVHVRTVWAPDAGPPPSDAAGDAGSVDVSTRAERRRGRSP